MQALLSLRTRSPLLPASSQHLFLPRPSPKALRSGAARW